MEVVSRKDTFSSKLIFFLLFFFFLQYLAKSTRLDFEQAKLHVFYLPQVNISDCNVLLYTPCQIPWLHGCGISPRYQFSQTINVYLCMGCEMRAFNNAPKCAQKMTLKCAKSTDFLCAYKPSILSFFSFFLFFLSFFWVCFVFKLNE